MKTTTLNKIHSFGPCTDGWRKLLRGLSKTTPDDEPLPYSDILRINGINDALWAVRCAGRDEIVDLACRYAESVAHLTLDPRAAEAVRVARGVIAGTHTEAEAEAAAEAARAEAWAAEAWAARAEAARAEAARAEAARAEAARAEAWAAEAARAARAASACAAAEAWAAAWAARAARAALAAWAASGDALRERVYLEWANS